MRKKKEKNSNLTVKQRTRVALFSLVLLGICASVFFNLFGDWKQIVVNRSSISSLNAEYNLLQKEAQKLESNVNKLQDTDYVARYAREKYLYTKDGELIIRIPKSEQK